MILAIQNPRYIGIDYGSYQKRTERSRSRHQTP